MKKAIAILVLGLLLSGNAYAHKAKNHKPLVCIPESERTTKELNQDKMSSRFHRLSKLQQACLLLRIEELEKENEELEKENKELKDKLNQ